MISARVPIIASLLLSCCVAALRAADDKPIDARIWKGVYTAAQAERGKVIYTEHCSTCHASDMKGVGNRAPALVGDGFMRNWENTTAKTLFEKLRDTMPATYPESLPENNKIDAMAFILKSNGFPAGQTELKIDEKDLDDIQIIRNVSQTAPNFALVEVVGCLTRGGGGKWALTHTTEPIVTKEESPTPAALKQAETNALGTADFDLVSAAAFKPEAYKDKKVEARGLLYRESGQNVLNLTSLVQIGLQNTGGSCQN